MSDRKNHNNTEGESGVIEKSRLLLPKMYKVLMHNDDYTTMEFVVHILEKFFNKDGHQATEIMLSVHTKGVGLCGVYTREIAEAKVVKVTTYARQSGHPLKLTYEPED